MAIYLDNAATTAVSEHVLEKMLPYFSRHFGNPSSLYTLGREAKTAVETARNQTADALGCSPEEIFFTSGGSEADNWAVKGFSYKKGKHIISTQFEHHAVLHTLKYMEKEGFEVTYLAPDCEGLIHPEDFRAAIRPDTALATIMFANNEIGVIQPIEEIAQICRENNIVFHTDAVQAVGHLPLDVKKMQIDMLSLSAHKFHGPKGIGALYVRKGLYLNKILHGGAQERGRRASTENVPGIVGLGAAIFDAVAGYEANHAHMKTLQDKLIAGLSEIPYSRLNGSRTCRLSNNVNFSFEAIEGESLLLFLDLEGICASSGSACTSGSLDPSHVLLSIGLPHGTAHGSLRLSLCKDTKAWEIDKLLEVLPGIVEKIRLRSPLWDAENKRPYQTPLR